MNVLRVLFLYLKYACRFLKEAFYKLFWSLKIFFLKILKHNKGRTGLYMVLFVVLVAVFAPLLTPYDPKGTDITGGYQKPSLTHVLGADGNGTDILAQVLYGTRVSLIIGILAGISVTLLGAIMGIMAGYLGKVADTLIMRVVDVLLVIPVLPLMIILNKEVSSSYLMMIFIFVAFGWSGTSRVVRSQVLSLKNINYVKAAEIAGAGKGYIMLKHILPAVSHLLIMNCALSCAGFIIAEAGLSFLGLGDPNAVSWGQLLVKAEQGAYTPRLWAWILAPGLAIFFTVMGFMQLGYALEDIFNPRMAKNNDVFSNYKNISKKFIDNVFQEMEDIDAQTAKKIYQDFLNSI